MHATREQGQPQYIAGVGTEVEAQPHVLPSRLLQLLCHKNAESNVQHIFRNSRFCVVLPNLHLISTSGKYDKCAKVMMQRQEQVVAGQVKQQVEY